MLVKDWMTREVITVEEDVSIMKASKMMKEKGFQHLPVLRKGRLTGIVSDRDLKEAHPSKATTLDIHELYYLLDKLKVEKVMSKNPYTVSGDETTDKATYRASSPRAMSSAPWFLFLESIRRRCSSVWR